MGKESEQVIRDKETLKKLGDRLKEIRKSQGHKSSEAGAGVYGVNRVQYSRYEAGRNIEYLTLIDLINNMGIPVSEFFSKGFD